SRDWPRTRGGYFWRINSARSGWPWSSSQSAYTSRGTSSAGLARMSARKHLSWFTACSYFLRRPSRPQIQAPGPTARPSPGFGLQSVPVENGSPAARRGLFGPGLDSLLGLRLLEYPQGRPQLPSPVLQCSDVLGEGEKLAVLLKAAQLVRVADQGLE